MQHPAVWMLKLGDCASAARSVDVISYDGSL
jgi:hypothetical protein